MFSTFIDFHCHPAMKPYGKSFAKNKKSSTNRKDKTSLWFYDPPNAIESGFQMLAGVCKFTQCDLSTLIYGNVQIVCASYYPIERGFFKNELGTNRHSDLMNSFVTGVGPERVDFVQHVTDYFSDLEGEYEFYRQHEGKKMMTDAGACTYKLVKNFAGIESYTGGEAGPENTVFIIPTIEGMHVLHSNIDAPDEHNVMANLEKIRNWEHPPFFVTFAHHFYNHLGGHARSLSGMVGNMTDQSFGLGDGITGLGFKVLDGLLQKDANGRRILVDVKHMSARSRKEYYEYLEKHHAGDQVPIIISHGAANGLRSMDEPVADIKETSPKLLAEEINFYDNELVVLAKSGGIIGLQLDERRIASQATLKNTKHAIPMNKVRHYRAELFWNQIQHIAEVLDRHDLFAWDCIGIGSDFDGSVDPLNGYLTAETMPYLMQYAERYAHNYMEGRGKQVLKPYNQISPSEIVNRVFTDNGIAFLKKWFR